MLKKLFSFVLICLLYLGVNSIVFAAGIDEYTVLMLHFDGTNGSTTFTDDSDSAHSVSSLGGSTALGTTYKKFGTAAGNFTGSTDGGLTIPDSADFYYGTGDWTVDFWYRRMDGNREFIFSQKDHSVNRNVSFNIDEDNDNGEFTSYDGSNYTSHAKGAPGRFAVDTNFHHAAIVKSSTTTPKIKMYVDGVYYETIDSEADPSTIDVASELRIGVQYHTNSSYRLPFTGQLDEFRISKGIARWTSNFTPPTEAYSEGAAVKPQIIITSIGM